MALSKIITESGSKGHHRFSLEVVEDSTTAATNVSTLSYTFKIYKISSGWDWNSWGSRISYTVTIGTNTYSGTIPAYDGTSTVTLKTGNNISIEHEPNGSKTIDIGFVVTDTTGASYTCGNASKTDTFTLSVIPRASIFLDGTGALVNNTNVDGGIVLKTKKYDTSFYNKVNVGVYDTSLGGWYILDNATKYNVQENDSITFDTTLLNDLYLSSKPNAFVKIYLYLETYTDNTYETQIGTFNSVGPLDLPLNIQAPTFNNFTYVDANTNATTGTTRLTNDNQTIIKGYSTLKVTISTQNKAVANTRQTNMSHYLIDGQTVLYSESAINKSIANYNKDNISVYAVDERNVSSQVINKSFVSLGKFIDYTKIVKSDNQSYNRSDGGVGGFVSLSFSGSWWGNKPFSTNASAVTNSLTCKAKYRISGTSAWSAEQTLTLTLEKQNVSDTYYTKYSYNGLVNGDQLDNSFDVGESYDIMVIVNDELSSVEYTFSVHSGEPAIALYKNKASLGSKYDETLGGTQLWGNTYLNGDLLQMPVIPPIPTAEDLNIYSTTETIVGTYDNKPLYRKIVNFGALPNGSTATFVAHNITNLDVVTKITATGYDGVRWFPIPFAPVAMMFSSTSCSIRVDSTDIIIASSSDMSSYTCVVVLEYTKVTQ